MLTGLLRVPGTRRARVLQVSPCSAFPVSPAPPSVPGAGRGAVVPACTVIGPTAAGWVSVHLPSCRPLSGQTGFSIPLRPD